MDHQIYYDVDTEAQKNMLWWLYVGHAASVFLSLGLLSFIPLIINYVKRGRTEDSFLYSHHAWQIRSFWWYLVWVGIGGLVALSIIGIPLSMLIWGVAWLWKAYRLIRGFIDLSDNKAMPT